MPHDEHPRVVALGGEQGPRLARIEPGRQGLVDHRVGLQRLRGQACRVARAHARTRVDGGELEPEASQRLACHAGLLLALGREAAIGIVPHTVRFGVTVAEEPELLRHRSPGDYRWFSE